MCAAGGEELQLKKKNKTGGWIDGIKEHLGPASCWALGMADKNQTLPFRGMSTLKKATCLEIGFALSPSAVFAGHLHSSRDKSPC